MKVMFFLPSLQSGGAERVVSVLANNMSKNGIDVSIVTICNDKCCYEISKEVSLHCLDCDKDISLPTFKRMSKRINKIRDIIRLSSPDVAIAFMANTGIDVSLAARGTKVPVIVSERNDPKLDPPSRFRRELRKFAYNFVKGFVFQTAEAQAFFPERIRNRSTVIFNPLSPNLPQVTTGEKDKKIVAVGRLNKQKNYPMLFAAYERIAKKHPDYELEIYGEGVLEEQLKAEAAKIDAKVNFMGFCSDVHEKIKDAALYIMSSDFEGMPNALMEAMAIGLPCISTDCPCGGPKMLIENGVNGILVPVGDDKALEEAIDWCLSNTEKAEQMGYKASKIRERLSIDGITKQWLRFIEERIS